jgi:hypothetical protein
VRGRSNLRARHPRDGVAGPEPGGADAIELVCRMDVDSALPSRAWASAAAPLIAVSPAGPERSRIVPTMVFVFGFDSARLASDYA